MYRFGAHAPGPHIPTQTSVCQPQPPRSALPPRPASSYGPEGAGAVTGLGGTWGALELGARPLRASQALPSPKSLLLHSPRSEPIFLPDVEGLKPEARAQVGVMEEAARSLHQDLLSGGQIPPERSHNFGSLARWGGCSTTGRNPVFLSHPAQLWLLTAPCCTAALGQAPKPCVHPQEEQDSPPGSPAGVSSPPQAARAQELSLSPQRQQEMHAHLLPAGVSGHHESHHVPPTASPRVPTADTAPHKASRGSAVTHWPGSSLSLGR